MRLCSGKKRFKSRVLESGSVARGDSVVLCEREGQREKKDDGALFDELDERNRNEEYTEGKLFTRLRMKN